jgi:hypothetical protein
MEGGNNEDQDPDLLRVLDGVHDTGLDPVRESVVVSVSPVSVCCVPLLDSDIDDDEDESCWWSLLLLLLVLLDDDSGWFARTVRKLSTPDMTACNLHDDTIHAIEKGKEEV